MVASKKLGKNFSHVFVIQSIIIFYPNITFLSHLDFDFISYRRPGGWMGGSWWKYYHSFTYPHQVTMGFLEDLKRSRVSNYNVAYMVASKLIENKIMCLLVTELWVYLLLMCYWVKQVNIANIISMFLLKYS